MLKKTGILGLATAATLSAIATPVGAEMNRTESSTRPTIQPVSQEAVITGNDNRLQQNIQVIYIDRRWRHNDSTPSSSVSAPTQSSSQGIVRTPSQIPSTSENSQPVTQRSVQKTTAH